MNNIATVDRPMNFDRELASAMPKLRQMVRSLTGNPVLTEDVVQEAVAKALKSAGSFQPGTNLSAWLYTIARNEYFSICRRAKRNVEDPDGVHEATLTVPPSQDDELQLKAVLEAMTQLPLHMRRAIRLVGLMGYAYEEAAEMLGVPVGTIKSQVSRARAQLSDDERIIHLLSRLKVDVDTEPEADEEDDAPALKVVRPEPLPPPLEGSLRQKIEVLIRAGKADDEIVQEVGCSRAYPSQVRKRMGLPMMKRGIYSRTPRQERQERVDPPAARPAASLPAVAPPRATTPPSAGRTLSVYLPAELASLEGAVKRFIDAMIYKLRKNAHKGRWEGQGVADYIAKLKEEVLELEMAKGEGNDIEVLLEAADVANMAMIVASIAVEKGNGNG